MEPSPDGEHSLGPALHHAPKKMISLISSRFYFENMPALCKQIAQCCYICQEGKHSIAVSRTDAHKRMLTPTSPAEAWSLDLLELPCSGGRGRSHSAVAPAVVPAYQLHANARVLSCSGRNRDQCKCSEAMHENSFAR